MKTGGLAAHAPPAVGDGWARLNHHRHRDHHSLDADARALTNALGCGALDRSISA